MPQSGSPNTTPRKIEPGSIIFWVLGIVAVITAAGYQYGLYQFRKQTEERIVRVWETMNTIAETQSKNQAFLADLQMQVTAARLTTEQYMTKADLENNAVIATAPLELRIKALEEMNKSLVAVNKSMNETLFQLVRPTSVPQTAPDPGHKIEPAQPKLVPVPLPAGE